MTGTLEILITHVADADHALRRLADSLLELGLESEADQLVRIADVLKADAQRPIGPGPEESHASAGYLRQLRESVEGLAPTGWPTLHAVRWAIRMLVIGDAIVHAMEHDAEICGSTKSLQRARQWRQALQDGPTITTPVDDDG